MAITLPSLVSPKSQLWLKKGDSEKQWNLLEKTIRDHPFNHAVEIFLPGCNSLPDSFSSAPAPFYYHSHLPLSHFLQPHLLSRYFHGNKRLYNPPSVLSIGRRIDIDNVFSIIPPGKLMMSVDKDMYEQLGLQGTHSRYLKHRYLVEVDLSSGAFCPGKPGYERVKRCVTDRLQLEADYILTWENSDAEVQAQFIEDFMATKCGNSASQEVLDDFLLPLISGDSPHGLHDNGETVSCSAEEMHTWLGAVSCGIQVYSGGVPGDYVSTFTPPEPHSLCQYGIRTRWTGMVSSQHIFHLLQCISCSLEANADLPWASLSVWGFEDAPVSWRTNEHGWHQSGDNHYNIVLFRTGQYWILTSLGTHDII